MKKMKMIICLLFVLGGLEMWAAGSLFLLIPLDGGGGAEQMAFAIVFIILGFVLHVYAVPMINEIRRGDYSLYGNSTYQTKPKG